MALNKSKIAREFWRDIVDNNKIDLSNSDARKAVVNEFLAHPDNKKAGWKLTADKRFFRLGFDKICKERGISTHQFGIKPEPKKVKTSAGKMNINIKTNEKPVHPLFRKEETEQQEKQDAEKHLTNQKIPNTEQLQRQQEAAAVYTGQSVGAIFAMMFNILHSRYPACSPLTTSEQTALGDAWYPIMNEYLGEKGGKWILPIIVTAPIVIVRFSEFQRAEKEKEIEDEILKDIPKEKIPDEPKEKKKPDKSWSEKL